MQRSLPRGGQDVIVSKGLFLNVDGGGDEYDQVNYDGVASAYHFAWDGDTVVVTKPNGGTDRLTHIDGFWFDGSQEWKPLSAVLPPLATEGDDFIVLNPASSLEQNGLGGQDVFYVADFDTYRTSQNINGGGPEYDQVNYPGTHNDYGFYHTSSDQVVVTLPSDPNINPYAQDILTNIDGIWFREEQKWYSIDELTPGDRPSAGDDRIVVGPTSFHDYAGYEGKDVFIMPAERGGRLYIGIDGGGDEYDQVNYPGNRSDYTISLERSASSEFIRVFGPDTSDTLQNIDGAWFTGEQAWYSLLDTVDSATIWGTSGDDRLRGTVGDDLIKGGEGRDVFFESAGSNTFIGNTTSSDRGGNVWSVPDNDYDQVNYSQTSSDYVFLPTSVAYFEVEVHRPDGGVDYLADIQGVWFEEEGAWYSVGALLAMSQGDTSPAQDIAYGLADDAAI